MQTLRAIFSLGIALLLSTPAYAQLDFTKLKPDAICGDVGFYDFDSMVDGPAYYVDMKTGKVICGSGGQCQIPGNSACVCPPNMWPCPLPDHMEIYRKNKAR